MNNLLVKDVPFQGSRIKAAQDENMQIWVGVRWVCEAIGLTAGQIQGERKRIQNDLVLYKGERNLILPTSGGNQEVMCLQLEYLPLWLAKISITPRMKEVCPEVVEKLITYQLKAKDALAQAFIPKAKTTAVVPQRTEAITPIEKFFDRQNAILEKQTKIMEAFCQKQEEFFENFGKLIAMNTKGNVNSLTENLPVKSNPSLSPLTTVVQSYPVKEMVTKPWKNQIYQLLKLVIKNNRHYHGYKQADILSEIYHYMNMKYGVVWAQEEKEYREKHEGRFRTIDLIEENTTYKSILESILKDMIEGKIIDVSPKATKAEALVVPLAILEKDTSNGYMRTCKKVYNHMSDEYGVIWKECIDRYQSTHFDVGKHHIRKIKVVNSDVSLLDIFKKSVKDLCAAFERGDSIE